MKRRTFIQRAAAAVSAVFVAPKVVAEAAQAKPVMAADGSFSTFSAEGMPVGVPVPPERITDAVAQRKAFEELRAKARGFFGPPPLVDSDIVAKIHAAIDSSKD